MSGIGEYGSTTVGGAGYEHLGEGITRTEDTPAATTIATFDAQNIPMTPAFILWFAQSHLRDMDRQIRETMLDIQGTHSRAEAIGEEIKALRELDTLLREDDHAYSDGRINMDHLNDNESWELRRDLGLSRHRDDDASMRAEFRELLRSEYGIEIANSDTDFDLTTIKNRIDNLTEEQKRINAGNEMKMMGLQNAMQQRSQVLQAASNFLASIGDSADTIIGNLR